MPDEIIATVEKKDVNDYEGLEGDDLHDAMNAQAEEEIQAEKDGRDPKRVLDKQDESSDSEDEEGNSQESDEQGDDEQGKDDDANEDEDANKDDDSEDEESEEEEEGDLDAEITKYAEKEGMNYADAKEDLEKTKRIVDQYGNDTQKMAKAMREKDREYQKLRVEKEKAEKKEPMFVKKSDEQFLSEARELLSNPPDDQMDKESGCHKFVAGYRIKYPARGERMSDDEIIEIISDDALKSYGLNMDKKEKEVLTTADTKSDEFISALPKEDRRFIPEIKAILSKSDKFSLAEEDFNFKDVVDLIKGRAYDADIKAAEERGSKRGSEKPKIAGVQSANGGSNNGGRAKSGNSIALNEKQKKRALEMYGTNHEDNVCFEMYIDTWKDRIKDDPKFV